MKYTRTLTFEFPVEASKLGTADQVGRDLLAQHFAIAGGEPGLDVGEWILDDAAVITPPDGMVMPGV